MTSFALIPPDLFHLLRGNAADHDDDHIPLAKLFNPVGPERWLLTELNADEDSLFGLTDLGSGCPEIGTFSLRELEALALPFGLRIELDRSFRTDHRLSVWVEAAEAIGSISGAERVLSAARRQAKPPKNRSHQTKRDDQIR
jgi:hypothetical protein